MDYNNYEETGCFSGAGMSAESGINTFRDSNGLWEQYRIEEVATPEARSKILNWYNDFIMNGVKYS